MAWILWEIPMLVGLSPYKNVSFQFIAIPGAFSPAIAAFIVRKWITKEGFGDAGLHPNFRQGWKYYLIAWLLPLLVSGIILGTAVLFDISKPDFTLQRFAQWMGEGSNVPSVPPYLWLVLPIQFLIGALFTTFVSFGEEFGWRGYLQKRIMPGKPVWATVITGIIWGVWHFPLNIQGYNFPDNRFLGLIVFPITTIFLSIIFGWLQNKSDSVWVPSLAHAATNSVGSSLMLVLFMGGQNWIWVSYVGILSWVPLGALSAWILWRRGLTPEPAPALVTAVE
jgi:membrane protease YdiL (CAAX protease family)